MTREVTQPFGVIIIQCHRSLALTHGLLQRAHHALGLILGDAHAIHHKVDGVDLIAVEFHACRDFTHLAIDAGIDIASLGKRLEQFAVVTLAALDDGGEKSYLAPFEALDDKVANLLVGVVHHLLIGDGRVGS